MVSLLPVQKSAVSGAILYCPSGWVAKRYGRPSSIALVRASAHRPRIWSPAALSRTSPYMASIDGYAIAAMHDHDGDDEQYFEEREPAAVDHGTSQAKAACGLATANR